MENTLSATNLRITGKAKSVTPLTGTITTNGGIGCINIFCDKDISCQILISNEIQTSCLKVTECIVPNNIVTTNIGLFTHRWHNIYGNNLDIDGNIQFGAKNDDNMPLIEIDNKITINSDINILNNKKKFIEINNNCINIDNNIIINANSVEFSNNINVNNININKYISIIPKIIDVDTEKMTIEVTNSIIVLIIKIESIITFDIPVNNILIKVIVNNISNKNVGVITTNNNIIYKNSSFDMYYNNEVLYIS